jgi:short-subunit dehydrogenase
MSHFKDKNVLITGGSSGIGKACAQLCAAKGARVFLLARDEAKLELASSQLEQSGGSAAYFATDLTRPGQVARAVDQVLRKSGAPDILINSAGAGAWRYLDQTSPTQALEMVSAPYLAALYVTRAFLGPMLKRDQGHIVNLTSAAAFMAWPGATAYIATRWAMRGLHEALTLDLAASSIRTTLGVFAKVQSAYWRHNPGSEERVPAAQAMIRTLAPLEAADALLKGIAQKKELVAAPFRLRMILWQARIFPSLTRRIMLNTGHRRQAA